jgi:putative methyltransferase (TIGR04325 family)
MRDPLIEFAVLARLPLTRNWVRRRYDAYFAECSDKQLFRGVFESCDQAQASAPATKPLGYDNEASSELYLGDLRANAHDYPAMFWIGQSFADGMRTVVDVGGSVGTKYYAFSRLLPFPDDVRWIVHDVPAVVERGRRFAVERKAPQGLSFTTNMADADGIDVLFASGVLQYLPQTLAEILGGLKRPPRRVIVNTAAMHPLRSYFTLNSVGTAFCPYRVQAHGAFVRDVTQTGYTLRDHWQNPAKFIRIPFEQGLDLDTYSGYCFDRV